MKQFVVKNIEENQTLEKYVKKVLNNAPLAVIYKLFRKKDVKVNGHWQDKKYVLKADDVVSIYLIDEQFDSFKKVQEIKATEDISKWVVYEDNNILIINKPRGVLVQKAVASDIALDDMVISYLINKNEYDPNNSTFKPAPCHRLDRNTAGMIIFGKNIGALHYVTENISNKNKISKIYTALVKGVTEENGFINAPLRKNNNFVVIDEVNGKEALTKYKRIKTIGEYSLVEITLLTGRTHQIRVHFSSILHPVIGDSKYGDFALNKEIERKYGFKNQFLVASKLAFLDVDGPLKYLKGKVFEVSLPDECLDLLNSLVDNK